MCAPMLNTRQPSTTAFKSSLLDALLETGNVGLSGSTMRELCAQIAAFAPADSFLAFTLIDGDRILPEFRLLSLRGLAPPSMEATRPVAWREAPPLLRYVVRAQREYTTRSSEETRSLLDELRTVVPALSEEMKEQIQKRPHFAALFPFRADIRIRGFLLVVSEKEIIPRRRSFWRTAARATGALILAEEHMQRHALLTARYRNGSVPELLTDLGCRVVEVNSALLKLLGIIDRKNVVGLEVSRLLDLKGTSARELCRSGPRGMEITSPEERKIRARVTAARLDDHQGLPLGYRFTLEAPPSVTEVDVSGSLALTSREIDVAIELQEGHTSKEIAEKLGISESTVRYHRQRLRQKLGISGSNLSLRLALLKAGLPGGAY